MLPLETRRKADFIVSIGLIGVGGYILYSASQMPWASTRTGASAQWFLSPGLFPATLGMLLILFSLRVLLTAVKDGGHRGGGTMLMGWLKGLPWNRPVQRVVFMIALIGAYISFGIGNADYRLVSAAFLFVFIAAFWWPESGDKLPLRIVVTLAVSVLLPAALAHVFSTFLFVPMP
jgi:hypothetical protein